jgi:hypothetical protein
MKSKLYKNNAFVTFEKIESNYSRWYDVRLRAPNGALHDRIRCDDHRAAMDYWKAFNAIARNM